MPNFGNEKSATSRLGERVISLRLSASCLNFGGSKAGGGKGQDYEAERPSHEVRGPKRPFPGGEVLHQGNQAATN